MECWKSYKLNCLLVLLVSTVGSADVKICPSMEINFHADFTALRDCRIVVGHVRIANLPANMETLGNVQTDIEEITDYLLVYRAHGVESLRQLFPKLKLIRGHELLFDEYALVVAENRLMRNLGLVSLLRVQRGNIRIESNPIMCYVETVNWIYLLENATNQHFSLKNNRHPNHCAMCNETAAKGKEFNKYCWNFTQAYQQKAFNPPSLNCPDSCHAALGCQDDNATCCNRNCLTSCSPRLCQLCAGLVSQGKCVQSCSLPNIFVHNNRECITGTTCRTYGKIPHNGACVSKCPKYYVTTRDNGGVLNCKMSCEGNFVINKIDDLKAIQDCFTIHGSLSIELTHIKTKVSDLEKVLFKIKEIKGYLKITRSPQLVSLNFLKNLDTIGGNQLIEDKYALYIVNNAHLEHIWQFNQNVAILNGRVYFHLNPRLCYDKILDLKPTLKIKDISYADVSPNSNGERVICDKAVHTLNATVEAKNATAARIKVNPMSADDKDVLVGYLHHYKEAPVQNVTMYDGRHGCGHDNWLMDVSAGKNVRHVISNLQPYTQYAYFVKTLTMTDYHMQIDAYSKIQYFRTLPDRPGKVRKIYFHAPSPGEIVLHWWPPRYPNGQIEYYLINYEKVTKSVTTSILDSLKAQVEVNETCPCNIKDPDNSGPPPEDENYYNREQITYDEALPNIIYVSRHQIEMEAKAKRKRKKNDKTVVTTKDLTKQRRAADGGGSANTVSKDDTNKEKDKSPDIDMKLVEESYRKFRMEMERKALAQQDTGITDFPITPPAAVCEIDNPSVQYQLERSCVPREHFTGIKVADTIFTYTLKDLQPEVTYRISIRACVADLTNGCGKENSIFAETVSKSLDEFIKHIKLSN